MSRPLPRAACRLPLLSAVRRLAVAARQDAGDGVTDTTRRVPTLTFVFYFRFVGSLPDDNLLGDYLFVYLRVACYVLEQQLTGRLAHQARLILDA